MVDTATLFVRVVRPFDGRFDGVELLPALSFFVEPLSDNILSM